MRTPESYEQEREEALDARIEAHVEAQEQHEDEISDARETDEYGYPPDWPKCPGCGLPVLDGHITCGQVECDEGGRR